MNDIVIRLKSVEEILEIKDARVTFRKYLWSFSNMEVVDEECKRVLIRLMYGIELNVCTVVCEFPPRNLPFIFDVRWFNFHINDKTYSL